MPPTRRSLSPAALHILVTLTEGPRHGYAIKQEAESLSQGAVRLGPGTLYETIQRLLDAGLVRETASDARDANGQEAQRRYYELTARGRKVLGEEVEQWRRFVSHAKRRLEPA